MWRHSENWNSFIKIQNLKRLPAFLPSYLWANRLAIYMFVCLFFREGVLVCMLLCDVTASDLWQLFKHIRENKETITCQTDKQSCNSFGDTMFHSNNYTLSFRSDVGLHHCQWLTCRDRARFPSEFNPHPSPRWNFWNVQFYKFVLDGWSEFRNCAPSPERLVIRQCPVLEKSWVYHTYL